MKKIWNIIIICLCTNLCITTCICSEKENNSIKTPTIFNEQQFEIDIYGSIRVRNMDTPWNQTEGIYAEAKNLGPDTGYISIGYEIIGISKSLSWLNIREVLMENREIPVDSIINIGIFGGGFGYGLITFTVFIEGYGEDDGYYYEKTSNCICCGRFIFVLSQK